MPKTDIDYSNTVFYKIQCKNPDVKDVYIGHTTNFVQRKHAHKRNCMNTKSVNYNCKVYNIIREFGGWTNWKMEIIAFRECDDHYGARKIEQEYFEEYNATLNSIEPMPKPKVVPPKEIQIKPEKKQLKCETCNVCFQTKTAHDIHNQTNKHLKLVMKQSNQCDNTKKSQKSATTFTCEKCNFVCSNKYDYNKHIGTPKHIRVHENTQTEAKIYECDKCNNQYKFHSGLWKHKQTCKNQETTQPINTIDAEATLVTLIKQNQDFKTMIAEQYTQLQESNKQNIELQKQLLDAVNKLATMASRTT
jgi:hypothetical protein